MCVVCVCVCVCVLVYLELCIFVPLCSSVSNIYMYACSYYTCSPLPIRASASAASEVDLPQHLDRFQCVCVCVCVCVCRVRRGELCMHKYIRLAPPSSPSPKRGSRRWKGMFKMNVSKLKRNSENICTSVEGRVQRQAQGWRLRKFRCSFRCSLTQHIHKHISPFHP